MQLNYKVIFVADANATNTDGEHNATLNNMVRLFADVMMTEELLGFLQSLTTAREAAE
jgi:ureidoacrylate peracid hydrolase